jgi:hypothetical protein
MDSCIQRDKRTGKMDRFISVSTRTLRARPPVRTRVKLKLCIEECLASLVSRVSCNKTRTTHKYHALVHNQFLPSDFTCGNGSKSEVLGKECIILLALVMAELQLIGMYLHYREYGNGKAVRDPHAHAHVDGNLLWGNIRTPSATDLLLYTDLFWSI